ncbi:DNA-binding protein H-NS [Fluviicoccus keumensis]|uniref:DNA-binding protein H-NS n=1 Tax=Fluviicoccus keumensis TaxID=1435465 RepID=A0A4V2G632_9GAMM|nr:H-NS histone family protein [Fluviicoccus keumensis]RZU47166.1 DNA-binding protein H-NS [Fluviicoccus keumensis]
MPIDLSGLSAIELNEVITEAKARIADLQREGVKNAYFKVVQIANEVGLTVDELIAQGRGNAAKPAGRGIVPPRYRDPLVPANTWTGRGKRPRWVEERIAKGIQLEDMLIKHV